MERLGIPLPVGLPVVRVAAAVAVSVTLPLALWAATAQAREVPGQFGTDEDGRTVIHVLPGGPEWQVGIRPGQRVLLVEPGERPQDWRMETTDGVLTYGTSARGQSEEVGEAAVFGVAGVVLAALALLVIPVQPVVSIGLSATGAVAASVPLSRVGDYPWSIFAVVVLGLAGAWLTVVVPRRVRPFVAVGTVTLAVAWLASRHLTASAFDALETVRAAALGGSVVTGWLLVTPWRQLASNSTAAFPNRVDVVLVTLAILLTVAALAVGVPPWIVAAGAVALVVAYPRGREQVVRAVDRLVMADTRERAAAGAVEQERARLARDLHDVPLQELAAVIRNLETDPGASRSADALRSVAEHLRDVATELQPPQLADLGLEAAIRHLVRLADRAGPIPVELDIVGGDVEGSRKRAPSQVEVALYRIAQEAIGNAQRHSGASLIVVTLAFGGQPDVSLSVRDDGGGLRPEDVDAAQHDGHFGMVTMRQRAAMVGARLEVGSSKRGTEVRVAWPA